MTEIIEHWDGGTVQKVGTWKQKVKHVLTPLSHLAFFRAKIKDRFDFSLSSTTARSCQGFDSKRQPLKKFSIFLSTIAINKKVIFPKSQHFTNIFFKKNILFPPPHLCDDPDLPGGERRVVVPLVVPVLPHQAADLLTKHREALVLLLRVEKN